MKNHIIIKAALSLGLTGLFTVRAIAMTGSDSSTNYISWSDGSTGGTGFQPWSLYSNNHGIGYAGYENNTGAGDANINNGSVWKLYAVNFSSTPQWEEAIAYRVFTAPLSTTNDTFAISMEMQNANNGVGNPGQMGFALRHGNATGSGNQTAGARLQIYIGGDPLTNSFAQGGTNYVMVADNSGVQQTSLALTTGGAAFNFVVTLTSSNAYSLSITPYTGIGTIGTPVVVTGTLAGSGTIDSFSIFNWKNSTNNGCNSDTYFNNVSYSNSAAFTCPTIQVKSLFNPLKGTPFSFTIATAGGVAPYTFAQTGGTLPSGLSLSAGGVVSGTPTTLGDYTFTVTVTDANGCTAIRSYTLTVQGTGSDSCKNYASWVNGSTGGVGFGLWSVYYNYHGSGFCGFEKSTSSSSNLKDADSSSWKLYAIDFTSTLQQEEATAYRKLNTPLSGSGDIFSLSFQNGGVGNPGQVGFALRNGDITGSNSTITNGSNNRTARARLQIYYAGGDANLTVADASGPHQIGVPVTTSRGYDTKVTLTGPDTYSLKVTRYNGVGTFDPPVTVTGTLAGSGPIDSFAMFSWKNSSDNGLNGDSFFNNLGYTANTSLITNNVTFQVDMTAQIFSGSFVPGTHTVEVRGSFDDWTAGSHTLTNNPALAGNASNIYSGTVSIVGAVNSGESYKFVMNNPGATYENNSPKTSTLDTGADDYNRFFQLSNMTTTTLAPVLFSDLNTNDYVAAPTAVTFSVDMNGAVTTGGYAFGTSPNDTVWINGDFYPWYPWYTPADPSGTAGPAGYQMIQVGTSSIYTNTIIMPVGKSLAPQYKYGIGIGTNSPADGGPRDNEAVGGAHIRVIRSTATGAYTMPLDKFGNLYHEPFFSASSKTAGQLTVGALSGGAVPVQWLGRPGAHLQGTTNLTGSWTDYPNTDGASWSSGVSTTNGLLSVTNWPSTGNTYFRLVKP